MAKITFMGAGSSVFAKNILGDAMLSPALHDAHIALYDIDARRLRESKRMLTTLNKNIKSAAGSHRVTRRPRIESQKCRLDTHEQRRAVAWHRRRHAVMEVAAGGAPDPFRPKW